MGSITINGSSSGSVTISAPAVAGTTVLTLPAASTNLLTSVNSVPAATGTPSASNYLRGDGAWSTISGTPSGVVSAFAGSSAPTGWLLCSGAAVSRTTYADLFTAIGTTYGSGDGSTTFNLPDLRGRAVAGVDNMGGTSANRLTSGGSGITGTTLGAAGGSQTFTISTNEMPSHTHQLYFGSATFAGSHLAAGANNVADANGYTTLSSASVQSTGSGGASNVTQPTMVLNYIIKT